MSSAIDDLVRNAVHVLPEAELERKLRLGRPLRVKLGIDVTSPDMHIGHAIPLQRLRAFQDAGHVAVFIVGDYTTRIGDPSGRSAERPVLTDSEIDDNAKRYFEQARLIIDDDPAKLEVRFNGEWLRELDFAQVLRLTRTVTVARLLERDDFAKRYASNAPISVSELLYPLMQAYDSVAIEADVELGGTDQLYNLLTGRDVMSAYGLEPQVALTTPLLLGPDGEKMSKSRGNTIGLSDPPDEQFGRTMRISDGLLPEYYRLVMEQDPVEIGDDPMAAKLRLARYVVARSHGEDAAAAAEEHFARVVRRHEAPEQVPAFVLAGDDVDGGAVYLPGVLSRYMGVTSSSEGRRLIAQGAVKLDGEPVTDLTVPVERLAGALVQAGKRRFATFSPPEG